MLAQIRNCLRRYRLNNLPPLVVVASALASCATKEQPQLFTETKKESNLPWNKQERWENEGQLGQLAERFDQGPSHR